VANVIINPYAHTPTLNKIFNPFTPLWVKTLHAQNMERPFYFIACFLKVNFEQNPMRFFPIDLMNSFMENNNSGPVKYAVLA
jgi:hypothetical protein